MVNGIPGMEGMLRRRDLPGICRLPVNHFAFEFLGKQTQALTRASALILNTVEALEPQALNQISSHFPSTYTIGPVRNLLQSWISLVILFAYTNCFPNFLNTNLRVMS